MNKPLVSLLIPFKNTSKYLVDCLTSIQKQTYNNWEVIFVNDHSSDNSDEIVKSFAKSDTRIKLLENQNKGIISALRIALLNSSGIYISRMDSDDIMLPNKLASMVNDLKASGKNHIALGLVEYFSETSISDGYLEYQNWLNELTKTGRNFDEIYKECAIASPCWMVHKEDLLKCGTFNFNNYPEDYDLTFRFYKHGLKCIPNNKTLHLWRDYNSRTSKTNDNYNLEAFTKLKAKYFLDIDYDASRPLTIWGAGEKGKTVAKILIENNVPFYWLTENPNKSEKKVYNQPLWSLDKFKKLDNPQSIITIADEVSQKKIYDYFSNIEMLKMKDYFMFC
jgi:glycosyltransferase involved in cell wall biosynthesis